VIGDACIADAMPKSASAAVSQARQCARAIVALLAGREVEPPVFDSVCYSLLGPKRAIAIRGRFTTEEGRIVALESAPESPAAAGAQQAQAAQRWYRSIRADAFGS
jgi:sulfide dehydrogenase [flavocytochrome c] flavoprotein chain